MLLLAGFAVIVLFYFSLPSRLFHSPTSFVVQDNEGNLLSAAIAADGQWRFAYNEEVPEKFASCITTFEDKRFFYHPGVDPIAMGRALWQNLDGNKVVSGGSTLSMQVIRLSRKKERSIYQKLIETILAVRLEFGYSKKEILALYAANAPFGSNVVGLDAAAWRYYGRDAAKLSWAETATLAVLPNAPSLIHPGKNTSKLLAKRNALIWKLVANKHIDSSTAKLALLEPLPGAPLPLPQLAPHLLDRFRKDFAGLLPHHPGLSTTLTTTLQAPLQLQVTDILQQYHSRFRGNGINNCAAMVMEVETGNVLAYVGNIYKPGDEELDSHVDVLAAPRSPGSTLKPLLFYALQKNGQMLPGQLIADVPTQVGGYTPQNFDMDYDGAVPARQAISRSLNIPAVKMLQQYKYQRMYNLLHQFGFTTLKKPAGHYGLSLILGGCEVTPWELAGVYASLARCYVKQEGNKGKVGEMDWHMPSYQIKNEKHKIKKTSTGNSVNSPTPNTKLQTPDFLDYTALWHTFNAMQEVMRPGEEGLWNLFNSAQRVAWKTGTSFGFRDGWAIGLTPRHCVVVWVGNTDGEGRPELTGINTAAPILFDIFRSLPSGKWFQPPAYHFEYMPVCHQSGYKAGMDCDDVDTMMVSKAAAGSPSCPFHRIVHLDATGAYRVSEACVQPADMVHKSWFVLPPAMEFYYRRRHPDYQPLPPLLPGCTAETGRSMELLYPGENARLFIPKELTGERGKTILKAAHRQSQKKIFWHIDDVFTGTTSGFHQLAIDPSPGWHTLTLVDEMGERISRRFQVLEK